jgi:hypothetical protein
MAPVLQCPDCGTKHPLGAIPTDVTTFPCDGCGRKLKVPESVPGRAAAVRPAPAAAAPPVVEKPVTETPAAEAPPTQAVPTAATATAAAAAVPPRPAPQPDATQAMSTVAAEQPPSARPAAGQNAAAPTPKPKREKPAATAGAYAPVAWWIRLLLWVVAVPLAYFIVFELARLFGIFSSTNLTDVFLANGVSRFWPVARLLPVVALLTAVFVQGGVMVLGRRKARQGAPAAR